MSAHSLLVRILSSKGEGGFSADIDALKANLAQSHVKKTEELYVTVLTEGFVTRLRIAVLIGAFLALPVLVFEVAAFIFPALSRRERRERVDTALALVGLTDRKEHYPNELSGGQQQRVAIARALITDPTLIVADEPTGDLDGTTGEEILGLLERLNGELGKTIVMVTHDPKAAEKAHRLVHLEKGVLVE